MNAVQVVQNLLVYGCQFIVQPDDSVKSAKNTGGDAGIFLSKTLLTNPFFGV